MSEESKDDDMNSAISAAMRGPQMDMFQGLLAQVLASGIFANDEMYKIRQILEAYLLLKLEDRQAIVPDEEERKRLVRAHVLAVAFMGMQQFVDPWGRRMAIIPWSFPKQKILLYFGDFVNTVYPRLDEETKCDDDGNPIKIPFQDRLYSLYYDTFNGESIQVCLSLAGQFVEYARPKVLKLTGDIHGKFISPEAWDKATAKYSAGEKGHGGQGTPPSF